MNRLMIIPAAGLGSRLQSTIPKVLFPVNGRPMIEYLFKLYAGVVDQFIVVLHPSFAPEVQRHCARYTLPIEYAIQASPTGMLDAILLPEEWVRRQRPKCVWITWCDQIAVNPDTIVRLAHLSCQDSEAALIFPTMVRAKPYVHLVRDHCNHIVTILHRREGDTLPEMGESDLGLFSLSCDTYLNLLPDFARGVERSAITRERNFLPFIPWLNGRGRVRSFPGHDQIESVGINTVAELLEVETYFRHARKSPFDHHSSL